MLHWDLLTGALPVVLLIAAAAAAGFLLFRRGVRRWWAVAVPSAIAGSAALTVLAAWYVQDVWRPFPDPLPGTVLIWTAVIVAAVALAAFTVVHAGWRRRVGAALAVVAVALAGLNQINREYGYYPTLAAAFGQPLPQQVPLPPVDAAGGGALSVREQGRSAGSALSGPARPGTAPAAAPTGAAPPADVAGPGSGPGGGSAAGFGAPLPLDRTWRPPGRVPAAGVVSQVDIPGTVSHFSARPAWVYLPPAYLVSPRPNLPLLLLIAGQPGNPRNWIEAGHLLATMDRFAAEHRGLAPIVVMPDGTGSATGNPMCLNSALGNADTYLSKDVVSWALTHLQVDRDTAHWAVGGFSYGGTCSLQLAVTHPAEFPTFLDISGDVGPTLGSPALSAAKAFHGNMAALHAAMPLSILATARHSPRMWPLLHRMAGTFAVGTQDRFRVGERQEIAPVCAAAGIGVREVSEPGRHTWYVASLAFRDSVAWLAARMALT